VRAGWPGRPRLQVAVVGAGLAAVLVAGTVSAFALEPAGGDAAPTTAAAAPLDSPLRADRSRTVHPEGAVRPSPLPDAPGVAALAALTAPDVVVRSAGPLPAELVQQLRALPGVTASALADAGTVSLAGADTALLGVDPSEFRGFTPQETAGSDPLWQAVARGDLALSYSVHQQRGTTLGGDVPVGAGSGRVGAVAAFGLPAADVVASRDLARELGAVPDSVVVLAAPDLKTAALKTAVERLAGDAVTVTLLRAPDVGPSALTGRPKDWRELYVDSARYCPGLRWQVLAAIGQVESAHGKHLGPSSAGALGPMQFMPATWSAYGLDGDGDGTADIMNPLDAVPSAAHYLCRSGASRGESGLYDAVFAYNHADWYVQKVLGLAAQYR
jgi:Transglycosylase SLT domain